MSSGGCLCWAKPDYQGVYGAVPCGRGRSAGSTMQRLGKVLVLPGFSAGTTLMTHGQFTGDTCAPIAHKAELI